MILKKYIDFLNESNNNDILLKAEEYVEKELGCIKVNGRWDSNQSIIIQEKESSYILYNGNLLIPFGVINGDFSCANRNMKTSSVSNLPLEVKGNLFLENNHIKTLKDFNVKIGKSFDISNNHLNDILNLQNKINGKLNISGNMLKTLKGCPQEVESFNCEENWFNNLSEGPKKINIKAQYNTWTSRNNKYKVDISGSDVTIDDKKIPKIEREFYKKQSLEGIVSYWTELYKYVLDKEKKDSTEVGFYVKTLNWPKGIEGDNIKQSANVISKFSL